MKRIAALAIIATFLLPPASSRAADFDPNFVITDSEATETASFDAADIGIFLGAQRSGLYGYSAPDIDGKVKSAAEIIHGAAQRNGVSPRFLLALLQREQSLITDQAPTAKQLDWAAGFGVCDSCSMDDPALAKYKGFANQLEYAAANFRYFMDNGARLSGFRRVGVPALIDGVTVVPATSATANLYNYTPHLHAQRNFWLVWQKYFVRHYPSGSLVTAAPEIPGTWLIRYGERRLISSPAVLASRFDPGKVLAVEANDLLAYPAGKPIKFANYSLLRSPGGTVYLIVGEERRGFSSATVFRKLGFSASEVDDASWEDLNAYAEGAPLTLSSAYPTGALLQDPATGGVYFVQNGVKNPLYGKELLDLYFKNRKIKKSTAQELASFSLGDPVKLADGELVKAAKESAIYVISEGKRLPIVSGEEFEKQGWKWENVRTVSDKVLGLTPLGEAFDPSAEYTFNF